MKKINVMIGVLFLVLSAFPVLAQDAGDENGIQDSQDMVNDEGYGANDAEYYDGEINADTMGNDVGDDAAYNEVEDNVMDSEAVAEEGSETVSEGGNEEAALAEEEINEAMPADDGAAVLEEGSEDNATLSEDDGAAVLEEGSEAVPEEGTEPAPADNAEGY